MSLMFQRSAHNYTAKGYYPTDDETLKRISSALGPSPNGTLRLLDPCCGEGAALNTVAASLTSAAPKNTIETYGLDIDESRAWEAKKMLTRVVHADLQDCFLGLRQFGLLFLNPPYGNLVADRARIGDGESDRRLEKLFYRLTLGPLQFRGVLVLIIPRGTLDKSFAKRLANSFERVRVYKAPEQRFNQLVIFGVKIRTKDAIPGAWPSILEQAEDPAFLPECWEGVPYVVPPAPKEAVKLHSTSIDERQLADEIAKRHGLWSAFEETFTADFAGARRPLCAPSNWHLALALAGGVISGLVRHPDGRAYVVSGDTMKVQAEKTTQVVKDDDTVETVTTRIDRFVPMIRALDMSPASATFGDTLTVR